MIRSEEQSITKVYKPMYIDMASFPFYSFYMKARFGPKMISFKKRGSSSPNTVKAKIIEQERLNKSSKRKRN